VSILRRCLLALLLLAAALALTSAAKAGSYYMLLGSRVTSFDHPPVLLSAGRVYITVAALSELKTFAARSTAAPKQADSAVAAQPVAGGTASYSIAGHTLAVSGGGAVTLDGHPLDKDELLAHGGERYIAQAAYERLGMKLAYSSIQKLYQLAGVVTRIDYVADPPALTLICATPVSVEGVQEDDERITLAVEGGWLADSTAREFGGDATVSRLGFKSQPELGRSFIFIRQPRRSGFKVNSDPYVGFARIKFGNYFQLASWQQSSSGEISLNVQLGAPSKMETQLLDSPPRLVADFSGVLYEDATRNINVNVGRVKQIRVGSPIGGRVRVVLDLSELADYRVLENDGGARYYIQLLPPVGQTAAPAARRLGRTVMIDAGHGGSDPGAPGVLSGVWEASLNLRIANMLAKQLDQLGYSVLFTRTSDRFTSLGTRTDYANSVLPYVFVSVHCNSIEQPDFTGIMTFHYATSPAGAQLAALVHEEVLAATGATDKGVRTADFFVLRETVMPSVLVECGFLTNEDECRKLADSTYDQLVAAGIARGIDRYITGGF